MAAQRCLRHQWKIGVNASPRIYRSRPSLINTDVIDQVLCRKLRITTHRPHKTTTDCQIQKKMELLIKWGRKGTARRAPFGLSLHQFPIDKPLDFSSSPFDGKCMESIGEVALRQFVLFS